MYYIQENQAVNTRKHIQNLFREELTSSNFLYISRTVSDLVLNHSIKCPTLSRIIENNEQIILDLRALDRCNITQPFLFLSGSHVSQYLMALNGSKYRLNYITINSSLFYTATWLLRSIGILFIFFLLTLFNFYKLTIDSERIISNAKITLAKQVAHDIRSPLSALNSVAMTMSAPDSEQADLIKQVVSRINGIAEDLLQKSKELSPIKKPSVEQTSSCLLNDTIKKLVDEKLLEHKGRSINLVIRPSRVSDEARIAITKSDFSRILSNLLNNSIEASENNSSIYLESVENSSVARVIITDFGQGIPPDVLEVLTKEPISHGKHNSGNGVGIFHASQTLASVGGNISIQSKVGVGTQVTLSIPIISPH